MNPELRRAIAIITLEIFIPVDKSNWKAKMKGIINDVTNKITFRCSIRQ